MWDIDPLATEQALAERGRRPAVPAPPRISAWAQAGEFLAAPGKGIGQGALQTVRNVNAAAGAAGVSAIDPREDLDGYLAEQALSREGAAMADPVLRRGIEALRPDAQTATTASMILQDAARVLTKAGGYALVGGTPGAIVGTGLDEAGTGALELIDRGVDPTTAAKAGVVRGAVMAASVAAPVAGRTLLQSAGIVAATGPGLFIAEQAITREILERARYRELAAEFDPFDPVGLGVSTLVPAVFGGAVHLRRAARARDEGGGRATDAPVLPDGPEVLTPEASSAESSADSVPSATAVARLMADSPEILDAAHVAFRQHAVDDAMLGDRANLPARATHARALDDAVRAMDDGEPVQVSALEVDPVRAQRVADEVATRLRAVDAELAALRSADVPLPPAPEPLGTPVAAPAAAPAAANPLQGLVDEVREAFGLNRAPRAPDTPADDSPTLRRADRIATERPELPVRLDDDGSPARPAAELVASVSDEARRHRTERRAFAAAVECAIRHGE